MATLPTAVDQTQAEETLGIIQATLKDFSWTQAAVLAAMVVACVVAIRILVGLADRALARTKMDPGIRTFLRSGLKVILWMVALCVLLGYLGVPMTSLVALLSVLGLALSLAIQGTLSNLAGGIMLLTAHPFSAGDFVEAAGVSGTVQEVGLVYTKLFTTDNKVVYIPNGEISAKTLTNYNGNPTRRVELLFSLSYEADPEAARKVLTGLVEAHPLVLSDPEPLIRVNAYGSSAVEYVVRAWCATDDYWTVRFDLLEQARPALEAAGIEMTYDHLNVHVVEK